LLHRNIFFSGLFIYINIFRNFVTMNHLAKNTKKTPVERFFLHSGFPARRG